jgi:hypothetical protein
MPLRACLAGAQVWLEDWPDREAICTAAPGKIKNHITSKIRCIDEISRIQLCSTSIKIKIIEDKITY